MVDVKAYLQEKAELIEKNLVDYLPPQNKFPSVIHESMHYSVFAGGKRLRPILMLATGELFDGDLDEMMPYACAVELIHTYSLVHDDLPALDNDDLRRGKATNHKVFGEAKAILAGDGLLNRAYETMLQQGLKGNLDSEVYLRSAKEISDAIGTDGMIGGQVVDLDMEGKEIDENTLLYIHNNKTGKLLSASIKAGAILALAKKDDIERLSRFSQYVGLGFQIVDDILDVTGEEEKLGKKIGQDENIDKATFPRVFGLQNSKKEANKMIEKALEELSYYGDKANILKELTKFLINRDY